LKLKQHLYSSFLFFLIQIKETYREPAVIFWAYIFPLLVSGVLGLAFGSEKKFSANVAWIGTGEPPGIEGIRWVPLTRDLAETKLKKGELSIIASHSGDALVLERDPRNSEANFASRLIQAEILNKSFASPPVLLQSIEARGSRYIDFLIPGMIAFGVMNACLWGIGSNLVEMRGKKLLIRFFATPFPKLAFFLSFFLIRGINILLESLFLIGFAFFLFGVEISGSFVALSLLLLSGLVAFGGISILLGSRTAKSQIGYGLINAVSFPMMLCSGIFFSYQGFPDWAQTLIRFLPLTLLADSIRGVFLEGFTVLEVLPNVIQLCGIGVIGLFSGKLLFKWI